MAKDAVNDAMLTMIKNLEEKTGKKIGEWVAIVNNSKFEKHGELVNMLKKDYALGHGYANMIVHHAKQSHALSGDEDALVSEQYKGKDNLKLIYNSLLSEIKSFGSDVQVSPKKAYVSLRRKKQFAIIQPSTKARLDIGLNLKNVTPSGRLEASGSWNSMCNFRIKIEDAKQVDKEVLRYLKEAYEQGG
jgi:predicted transport protein